MLKQTNFTSMWRCDVLYNVVAGVNKIMIIFIIISLLAGGLRVFLSAITNSAFSAIKHLQTAYKQDTLLFLKCQPLFHRNFFTIAFKLGRFYFVTIFFGAFQEFVETTFLANKRL